MKIAIFGMYVFNFTKSLCYGFEKLGHDVMMVEYGPKIDLVKTKEEIIAFKPDVFINFCGNYDADNIDKAFLEKLGKCTKVLSFADAIHYAKNQEFHYEIYDEVYVFEESDVRYLKEKYGIDAKMAVASVAEEIFCKDFGEIEKKYDLSFVGFFKTEKKEFFEQIAKYAYENNLSMIIYGNFWQKKYFWQKIFSKRKFAKKYPYLFKVCVNETISPEDAALLYKQTRICLNKHANMHKSLGSKTFEIMATGSFELCDERFQAKEFGLIDGENIVFYENADDCIKKIEYYLKNDGEREKIAAAGAKLVREKHTTRRMVEEFLKT